MKEILSKIFGGAATNVADGLAGIVFLVVSTVVMIFIDAGMITFEVEDKWTDLLQLTLITVISAYFGGRSFEKIRQNKK